MGTLLGGPGRALLALWLITTFVIACGGPTPPPTSPPPSPPGRPTIGPTVPPRSSPSPGVPATRPAGPSATRTGSPVVVPNRAPTDPHYYEVMNIIIGVDGKPGDIDTFWRSEFPKLWPGKRYVSPSAFVHYYPGQKPAIDARCLADLKDPTTDLTGNAMYCQHGMSISWDENFLWSKFKEIGDMAPVAVIAHEWGHHIQHLSEAPSFSIQAELQADCFAGMYARYADKTGRLDPGDVQEASETMFAQGDKQFDAAGWFLPNVHGPPLQRRLAFLAGFEASDGTRCLAYGKYGAADTIALGAYQLALAPGTQVERRPSGTVTLATPEGKLEARPMPSLPSLPASGQLPGVAREWFGNWTSTPIGPVQTLPVPRLGGTAAFQYYQQEITEPTGKRTVHGIIFLHVGASGGGLLMDFYTPGPAPVLAAGWKPLDERMLVLLQGLGKAASQSATPTPTPTIRRGPTPVPRKP